MGEKKPVRPYLGWLVHKYLTNGEFEEFDNKIFSEGRDFVDNLMLLIDYLKRLNGGNPAVEETISRLEIVANLSEYEAGGYGDILKVLLGDLEKLGTGKVRAAEAAGSSLPLV